MPKKEKKVQKEVSGLTVADLFKEVTEPEVRLRTWKELDDIRSSMWESWDEHVAKAEDFPQMLAQFEQDRGSLRVALAARGFDVTKKRDLRQLIGITEMLWVMQQMNLVASQCPQMDHVMMHDQVSWATFTYHLIHWTKAAGVPMPPGYVEA